MEQTLTFEITQAKRSKISEVDFEKLEFGKYISDHMFVCDFANGKWQDLKIVPYANLSLSPSALGLHYGQTVFEGMKAFRMVDGRINIFRIEKHYDRFVKSLRRMCMAVIPEEIFTEGIIKLIETDQAWVPSKQGHALYIRPFMFASESRFGVKISDEYRFIIFTGPVPSLYADPIKVKIETHYVRAAKGGTGFAKCGGNYGASFLPTLEARNQGYDQVLWTDGKEHQYIEESGMMNIMFVIGNTLITPALSDSILDGVTRDSLLSIAGDMGYTIQERQVSITELEDAFNNNTITEAFGAGTAAVVAPIKTICINGIDFQLTQHNDNCVYKKLKKQLELIRSGEAADIHEWNFIV